MNWGGGNCDTTQGASLLVATEVSTERRILPRLTPCGRKASASSPSLLRAEGFQRLRGCALLGLWPGETPTPLHAITFFMGQLYQYEATTSAGFLQQLAVAYLGHGYWFYVTGRVPEGKDPAVVDRKLLAKYQVELSKWARARRKASGLANVQYLRFGRFFVLLATRGEHPFFEGEEHFKDAREEPIRFGGYSVSVKRGVDGRWHPSVRLHPETYREVRAHFLGIATHRSVEVLSLELRRLPFEPYAPVRRQLLNLLRALNRARHTAGLEPVPTSSLRLSRMGVKPFGEALKEAA